MPNIKGQEIIWKGKSIIWKETLVEKIIKQNKKYLSAIKMEVSRNVKPKKNFLEDVRYLANKNKILLIFDECTSGFRQNFGGLHKY